MNKTYLFILLCFFRLCMFSQSYVGLFSDNYSGIHGGLHNPASIADSPVKFEVNLAGLSAYLGNDFYGFKALDLANNNHSLINEEALFPAESNNLVRNVDVLGPSVMFSISRKTSFAVFTRARFLKNITNVNGNEFLRLQEGFNNNSDLFITEGGGAYSTHAWAEVGVTLANILISKEKNFIKGGVTFKYLRGLGNAYGTYNGLALNYESEPTVPGSAEPGSVTTTGEVTYAATSNFEVDNRNFETVDGASAFAFDLGIVYERRSEKLASLTKNRGIIKYKYKLGISLTDVGAIAYDGIEDTFNVETVLSQRDFESIEGANDLREFYAVELTSQYKKASLPTAAHVFADFKLGKKTFVNFNGDFSLREDANDNTSKIAGAFRFTPRYESKWLSVMVPISSQEHSGVEVGGAIRFGPIYAGSGSFLTSLLKDNVKAADAYIGVKIPLYHPKLAVPGDDELEEEKEEKGKDKSDKEKRKLDKAKEKEEEKLRKAKEKEDERLRKENEKTNKEVDDNSSIVDINDTDGDGIPNLEDECPETAGIAKNNGCPKVETTKVKKALSQHAKTILFKTGSSKVELQAQLALDEVIEIIKLNPYAQFVVEGHTDSVGGDVLNEKLSYSRAHAVMNYLIENGIDRARLSVRGFGATKPATKNTDEISRALNRRVEIRVIK